LGIGSIGGPERLKNARRGGSTRSNIGIVLDEILDGIVGCKFGVASFDDLSPPIKNERESKRI